MFSQPIVVQDLTPEALVFFWGIVQSLLFEYVPGIAPWFAQLTDVQKRAVQAGGLFVVAVGLFGLMCSNILSGVSCDQAGAVGLLVTYFLGLMANQTTHLVFKKSAKS